MKTTSVPPTLLKNASGHCFVWLNRNKYNLLRYWKKRCHEKIIKAISRDILCVAKRWLPKNVLRVDKCWTYFFVI